MRIGIPAETAAHEHRVAMVPDVLTRLVSAGYEVAVQSGAGAAAGFSDGAYRAAGAAVVDGAALAHQADVVLRVQAPTPQEVAGLRPGTAVMSFLAPWAHLDTVQALAAAKATAFSLELLPRISRAQSMDALSSQATVSGYLAALIAATNLPKFFPMFMTAAGTVPPAKVFVMGAGVAGLQAIATCRRLGANVRAYDVRPAAAEEVASLGATFVKLDLETQEGAGGYAKEQSEEFLRRQQELMTEQVAGSDVVITTAAVPGRPAPRLVTTAMVEAMAPGSVIVDIAAEGGGNCELSRPGETVVHHGVSVIGTRNLPSRMPTHASFLYARNLAELVQLMTKDGAFVPDFDDEVVSGCCVVRDGEVVHEATREALRTGARS